MRLKILRALNISTNSSSCWTGCPPPSTTWPRSTRSRSRTARSPARWRWRCRWPGRCGTRGMARCPSNRHSSSRSRGAIQYITESFPKDEREFHCCGTKYLVTGLLFKCDSMFILMKEMCIYVYLIAPQDGKWRVATDTFRHQEMKWQEEWPEKVLMNEGCWRRMSEVRRNAVLYQKHEFSFIPLKHG